MAKDLFESQPDKAFFLMREAARGGNLDYTVAAVSFLEGQDRQADIIYVLRDEDIAAMDVDELTKFRLYVQRGHAARAAGETLAALDAYAKAQAIYPQNDQVISFAFTEARQATQSSNLEEFRDKLLQDAELFRALAGVYAAWGKGGKPTLATTEGGTVKEALRFSAIHMAAIR
jgi:anion-transporting  ArsA/GET3 family ATPase